MIQNCGSCRYSRPLPEDEVNDFKSMGLTVDLICARFPKHRTKRKTSDCGEWKGKEEVVEKKIITTCPNCAHMYLINKKAPDASPPEA